MEPTFITTFKGARHWSWCWSRYVQSTSPHHVSLRFLSNIILLLTSVFSNSLFPSHFPTQRWSIPCRWQSKKSINRTDTHCINEGNVCHVVVIYQPVKRSYGRKVHRNMSVWSWLFCIVLGPTHSLKDKANSFLTLTYLQSRLSCVNKTRLFSDPKGAFSRFCLHILLPPKFLFGVF
jgi:hypothetical protein